MQSLILKMYVFARTLLAHEEAQNLTEYALCFTVIALGSVAGMSAIATSVGHTFVAVTNTFSSALR
jgi:Flp pilus assembly pilin Flp